MRGAMPTHLGANPRNHVNHDYSCSSLENFYYYERTKLIINNNDDELYPFVNRAI
jgi:hypothetical protein